MARVLLQLRKLFLRYCTALAMVAPTMQMRIRFNRLKGVRIGRDPWLGVLVYLDIHHSHPDRENSLILGDRVAIGNNVSIYTHDSLYNLVTDGREPVNFGRVVIGDHVNVSPNAFLYDCRIGSHSIVAPGAVVAGGEYPPYSLIAGNPAKVVKDIRARVERSLGHQPS
jgi:acetyltransferase-like isoleucine patch superfamily enzyme